MSACCLTVSENEPPAGIWGKGYRQRRLILLVGCEDSEELLCRTRILVGKLWKKGLMLSHLLAQLRSRREDMPVDIMRVLDCKKCQAFGSLLGIKHLLNLFPNMLR